MYKKFLEKIDQKIESLYRRNPRAFTCKLGCADCCVGGISVCRVEHDSIREHLKLFSSDFHPSVQKNKCPFLNDKDLCSIYPARPVVCRLWGAPLLFGSGKDHLSNADEISRRITSDRGVLTCCSKNFTEDISLENLEAEDIINLEIVHTTLAAINHVYCKELGFDSEERFRLNLSF